MNLLVKALDNLPDVLRRYAGDHVEFDTEAHYVLMNAADALDDALDAITEGDE